jgi:Putative Actinobacterial Holin-X, holin superfamily III
MSDPGRSFRGRVREVGEAFLGLLRAEAEALLRDFGASGRALARVALLAALAGGVVFWSLGLAIQLGVEVAALWLPRWGAVAVVLGVFLVLAGGLAALAVARLRRIEKPSDTVRRRLEENRRWWRERIEGGDESSPPASEGEDDGEAEP